VLLISLTHTNTRTYKFCVQFCITPQAIAKGSGIAFPFDGEVLVRELTVKGAKCIQLQKIGDRKEHQFKFEVDTKK